MRSKRCSLNMFWRNLTKKGQCWGGEIGEKNLLLLKVSGFFIMDPDSGKKCPIRINTEGPGSETLQWRRLCISLILGPMSELKISRILLTKGWLKTPLFWHRVPMQEGELKPHQFSRNDSHRYLGQTLISLYCTVCLSVLYVPVLVLL